MNACPRSLLIFYLISPINHQTCGNIDMIIDSKTQIARSTIIGVKSIGQIVVGIIFFIFRYIGSKIAEIIAGLNFIQAKVNQDKITSAIIKYEIISKKIIKAKIRFSIDLMKLINKPIAPMGTSLGKGRNKKWKTLF